MRKIKYKLINTKIGKKKSEIKYNKYTIKKVENDKKFIKKMFIILIFIIHFF